MIQSQFQNPKPQNGRRFGHLKFGSGISRGFTMVEIVVMLAIITLIASIVLGNFTGFNEAGAMTRAAQEMAANLRRAQNNTLSVSRITLADGTLYDKSPKGIGLHFDNSVGNNTKFIVFLEDEPNLGGTAGIYEPGIDKLVSTNSLLRGVAITSITTAEGCTGSYIQGDIVFRSPEATVMFSGDTGSGAAVLNCPVFKVKLVSPTLSIDKKVIVRLTGQIVAK